MVACGSCPGGQTCGGDGPNRCGAAACQARTCFQLGASCGTVSNGCDDVVDCGDCGEGQTCLPNDQCSGGTGGSDAGTGGSDSGTGGTAGTGGSAGAGGTAGSSGAGGVGGSGGAGDDAGPDASGGSGGTAGSGGDGCTIAGTDYPASTPNPANACELCDPDTSPTSWANAPAGTDCPDDGNPCTTNTCDGLGTCQAASVADGTSCGSARFCVHGVCQSAGCFIAGQAYAKDDVNPSSNGCQVCDTTSPTAWTDRPAGTPCPDDSNPCTHDACGTGSTSGTCQHAAAAEGDPCGAGLVCHATVCTSGCFIGSTFHADGAPNPSDPCALCDAATSSATWSPAPDGQSCAGNGFTCTAGVCLESSCTSGAWLYETIDAYGDMGNASSLAVDASGGLHVGSRDGTSNDLKYAYHAPRGYWAVSTLDDTAAVGSNTATAYDSSGGTHVMYFDATNHDLRYAYRAVGGTWSFAVVPDAAANVGAYPSIAVDSGNNVYVAYHDTTNTNLKVAFRPSGGAWQTPATVDGTNDVGQYTSIAIDPTDGVHVAYYDVTNADLRYAYKAPGGAWQTYPAVDSTGTVGQYTSIAVDSSGEVHIVYYDVTNTNLKYTRKPSGGGWQAPATIDATANVGMYASLAIDSAGDLHVS